MDLKRICEGLRDLYLPTTEAEEAIEKLAWALANIMDGLPDHDIQAETGMSMGDCNKIASIRKDAAALIFGGKN